MRKPRISVSLSQESYDFIVLISKATGTSLSQTLSSFIEETLPTIKQTMETFVEIQTKSAQLKDLASETFKSQFSDKVADVANLADISQRRVKKELENLVSELTNHSKK